MKLFVIGATGRTGGRLFSKLSTEVIMLLRLFVRLKASP